MQCESWLHASAPIMLRSIDADNERLRKDMWDSPQPQPALQTLTLGPRPQLPWNMETTPDLGQIRAARMCFFREGCRAYIKRSTCSSTCSCSSATGFSGSPKTPKEKAGKFEHGVWYKSTSNGWQNSNGE